MATWDGSYPEPDGSNYYVNSYGNHSSANVPPYNYYVPNAENTYTQNAAACPTNTSMIYNQSTSKFYDPDGRNTIPSTVMSNFTTVNVGSRQANQVLNVGNSSYYLLYIFLFMNRNKI